MLRCFRVGNSRFRRLADQLINAVDGWKMLQYCGWVKITGQLLEGLCVCVLPGSFRGMGAFYFKKEIEETFLTLLTRITAHKKWEFKHKHHIQSLENDAN